MDSSDSIRALKGSHEARGRGSQASSGIAPTAIAVIVLIAALIITGLASYVNYLLQDNENLNESLNAAKADVNQATEKIIATRSNSLGLLGDYSHGNSNSPNSTQSILVRVSNNGSIPSSYRYVLLHCTSIERCPPSMKTPMINPSTIFQKGSELPVLLNPGETKELAVGPVSNGLTYRVDIITDRGNVIQTAECTVDVQEKACSR